LDQEQIALAQHMPAETIAQGDAGALGGETHRIETLAKAQVPPVLNLGTGRGSSVKIPYELVERRPGAVPRWLVLVEGEPAGVSIAALQRAVGFARATPAC
jgi:hypothetical protein